MTFKNRDGDTLTLNNNWLLEDCSCGEIVNYKVVGFVKICDTTYVIVRCNNTLLAYSIAAEYPFVFTQIDES